MLSKRHIVTIIILIAVILILALAVLLADRVSRSTIDLSVEAEPTAEKADSLFTFDPNTVSYEQLLRLGIDKHTAVSILKYRARGKVFEIAEEFALCYGVTDSMFSALRPYIVIGEQFRAQSINLSKDSLKERAVDSIRALKQSQWQAKIAARTPHPYEPFRIDTVGIEYLHSIGFTYRQAEGLIEYRDKGQYGIRNMAELSDCWAVSEQMADSLVRYIIFPEPRPAKAKVEINSADSLTLIALRGIGPRSAQAIVEYRRLLGGYHSVEQLLEIKCITSENFALFSKEICCDSCVFSKIDINFAPAFEMEMHPYMTRRAINRIIELRKSKGGWKSFEEIVSDDIFTQEQALSLEPYLHFGTIPLDLNQDKN